MKKLGLAVLSLVATLGMANVATAKTTYIKPFTAKVNYTCQQGKNVAVRYSFNKYGLPTSASAYLNGANRVMLRNKDTSDNVDTFFGTDGSYNMGTTYMDSKNYRTISRVNILSPNSEMLYKGCSPR